MKVSVVMTVYNGQRYLQEAVESILRQTYANFEFVIVNDGSVDNTKSILDHITDRRVKVIHLEENNGSVYGLNFAIENTTGEWIAIQDADDFSHPRRLEVQTDYIQTQKNIVVLGSRTHSFTNDPLISQNHLREYDNYWNHHYFSEEKMREERFHCCPLCHGSVMFNREAFYKVGKYDPQYKILYDYQLWIRMFEIGRVVKVPEYLYFYRIHSKSLSQKDQMETGKEMMQISTKYIKEIVFKKVSKPRFVMFGPEQGCTYYQKEIYPSSGIQIKKIITNNYKKNYSFAVKSVKSGLTDGVLVLDGPESSKLVQMLIENGLRMNRNLFRIENRFYTSLFFK